MTRASASSSSISVLYLETHRLSSPVAGKKDCISFSSLSLPISISLSLHHSVCADSGPLRRSAAVRTPLKPVYSPPLCLGLSGLMKCKICDDSTLTAPPASPLPSNASPKQLCSPGLSRKTLVVKTTAVSVPASQQSGFKFHTQQKT